ncbi:MAG: gliding motility-associated C-terminal domain-containing protein [Saprospiraceae bacterium]
MQDLAAQSIIILESCGTSYIDPQAANDNGEQTRDTLIYHTYFGEDKQLRAFYVDINAFGGQQVDRAAAFAIMPDSSFKSLGAIAFGSCSDCVGGFALVLNDSLMVSGVGEQSTLDLWLRSFNQPPFTLTGNLQTLSGVGRLSGEIPVCAIGLQIEFSVYSNPANTSTSFAAHIVCPETITPCNISLNYQIDCQADSLYLNALLPAACYSADAAVQWSNRSGWHADQANAVLPLSGNLGWYYFQVEEACCVIVDSILIENPPFAQAGADRSNCEGEVFQFAGQGGFGHFWESPTGNMTDSLVVIAEAQAIHSGQWVLHAFNTEGCEDTDTLNVMVHVPPTPLVQSTNACLGETVSFLLFNDTAFTQVEWFDPTGAMLPSPFISDLQPAYFGTYSVEGEDQFGCIATQSFVVSGSEPPSFEVLIEDSCDSSRVYLLPEDLHYQWETGDTSSTIGTPTGGTFQVTITDPTGCSTVSTINIPRPDGPDFDIQIEHPFCPNETGSISIIPADLDRPMIFSIDRGETYVLNGTFEQLPPGTYYVTIQDDLGCIQERKLNVIAPDTLAVSLGVEALNIRPLTPVDLTANIIGQAVAIQWIPASINTGNLQTSFIAEQDMDIRIVVEDERGCRVSDGFPLSIVLGDIYVPNSFSPNDDGINDWFTFFSDGTSGESIASLLIFDRQGNLVFKAEEIDLNIPTLGWDGFVEGQLQNPGVFTYYGLVRFGNGVIKKYEGDVMLLR